MAGITLAQAEDALAEALSARTKILAGETIQYQGRTLTRSSLDAIRKDIVHWSNEVSRLTRGAGVSVQRIVLNG